MAPKFLVFGHGTASILENLTMDLLLEGETMWITPAQVQYWMRIFNERMLARVLEVGNNDLWYAVVLAEDNPSPNKKPPSPRSCLALDEGCRSHAACGNPHELPSLIQAINEADPTNVCPLSFETDISPADRLVFMDSDGNRNVQIDVDMLLTHLKCEFQKGTAFDILRACTTVGDPKDTISLTPTIWDTALLRNNRRAVEFQDLYLMWTRAHDEHLRCKAALLSDHLLNGKLLMFLVDLQEYKYDAESQMRIDYAQPTAEAFFRPSLFFTGEESQVLNGFVIPNGLIFADAIASEYPDGIGGVCLSHTVLPVLTRWFSIDNMREATSSKQFKELRRQFNASAKKTVQEQQGSGLVKNVGQGKQGSKKTGQGKQGEVPIANVEKKGKNKSGSANKTKNKNRKK